MLTIEALGSKVREMRAAQAEYFRTLNTEVLKKSIGLESRVDAMLRKSTGEFAQLVTGMRAAQRAYFMDRSQGNKKKARDLEARVDALVATIKLPPAEAVQKSMF